MIAGQVLDLGAAARLVAPQGQEVGNVLHREAQVPRPADEAQGLYVAHAVNPVARGAASGLIDQADALVVTDSLGRHAGFARHCADLHLGLP
jgi:hypothetical protein